MSKTILTQHCQICPSIAESVFTLSDLPLVDQLIDPAARTSDVPRYPTPLQFCPQCHLLQLGCIVDAALLFPLDYPYTTGTTKILRDNFAELAIHIQNFIKLNPANLIIDIGCNDGTLLNNLKNHARVLGVTPENIGHLAVLKGIPVLQSYFTNDISRKILSDYGQADVITATNVLAHIKNIDEVLVNIKNLLKPNGLVVCESGYLSAMLNTLQYDLIYHEHLRYYSLTSLQYLFQKHDLEIIHAKLIPTHGGSLRISAAYRGQYPVDKSVARLLSSEKSESINKARLMDFYKEILQHQTDLLHLLLDLKRNHKTIVGISAPARATALMNYAGINETILDNVVEVEGSFKIGKTIPGTQVKIVSEQNLYHKQPDYALMLSWHIAQELMPKLKSQGFRGDFILPLPQTAIMKNKDV